MKYVPYILILILVGVVVYLIYSHKPIDIKPFEDKIDSLNIEIKKDKKAIDKLLEKVEKQDVQEKEYLVIADSLATIISKLNIEDDCPKIVATQGKEIIALRETVKICNKSKGIYKVSLGICQDIVIKNELILVETSNMQKVYKKEVLNAKKKFFMIGSGSTALTILILLLLL